MGQFTTLIKSLDDANYVWHYTNLSFLQNILLGETSLCATHFKFLNDSKEYKYGLEQIKKVYSDIADIKQKEKIANPKFHKKVDALTATNQKEVITEEARWIEGQDIFVICFSRKKDDLSLWRSYAPNGGVCVGFLKDELLQLLCNGENRQTATDSFAGITYSIAQDGVISAFGKCHYGSSWLLDAVQKHNLFGISDLIDNIKRWEEEQQDMKKDDQQNELKQNRPNKKQERILIKQYEDLERQVELARNKLRTKLTILSAFCKHPAFEYEDEFRIVLAGDSLYQSFGIVADKPRVPIDCINQETLKKLIKKVVVSPHGDKERDAALVRLYANKMGFSFRMEQSQSPYRGQ